MLNRSSTFIEHFCKEFNTAIATQADVEIFSADYSVIFLSRIETQLPYRYSNEAQNYYLKYFFHGENEVRNTNLYFKIKNEIIGFTPISFSDKSRNISSNGELILFPFFEKGVDQNLRELINILFAETLIWFSESKKITISGFQEYEISITPRVTEILKLHKFSIGERQVFYKDCKGSRSDLWKSIRKSYKPYINNASEYLEIGIATGYGESKVFDQFRDLHKVVAERVTRSVETWNHQRDEMLQGKSFLCFAKYSGELVGGALICHNTNSALYSVGAYRRDLNDLHLGHILQWSSILYLNRMNISKYRIGDVKIKGSDQASTKENSIALFKRGFSDSLSVEKLFTPE